MNDKTDRASEIMKQMEFVEQLIQKLNKTIYLNAQTAIGSSGMCGYTQVQSDIKRLRREPMELSGMVKYQYEYEVE